MTVVYRLVRFIHGRIVMGVFGLLLLLTPIVAACGGPAPLQFLTITAKAKTIGKVLQTHFVNHRLNGRTFYAPATPPKLPKFLADSIAAITGLDNYSTPPQTGLVNQQFKSLGAQRSPDCSPESG